MYKFKYNTLEERKQIEEENKQLYLIEDSDLNDEKYLVYTNEKPYVEPTWEEDMEKKISILNEQNSKLLLDKAKNEIQINTLNKNLANVTLEVAKMKGGM